MNDTTTHLQPSDLGTRATIFLGAGAISMTIAEPRDGELHVVDELTQPIELAHDIFLSGSLSRDTMNRCTQIVQGYLNLLQEYHDGEQPIPVRLLGTNIFSNITNLDIVINRIFVACGLRLNVMDDGEMTRLLYQNVQHILSAHEELIDKTMLVLHVGPGNTRLLYFDEGRITYYANYRMGAYRTAVAIGDSANSAAEQEVSLIREHIRGVVEQIRHDSEQAITTPPEALVIIGPDFRRIESPLLQNETISTETLAALVGEIARTPLYRRMDRYNEDYATVSALLPAVVSYLTIAREFMPESIVLTGQDGYCDFLRDLLPGSKADTALDDEVIHFSQLLANRYHVDRGHSRQVHKLSTMLFDQLQDLHKLNNHDRLLLKVAAELHKIGTFISPKNHHRHGQYIVLSSEIFGLSRRDIEIVGLLVRHHRHGLPTTDESAYAKLDPATRLRVQKLTALLRVASAMERAHRCHVKDFSVRFSNRRLEVLVPGVHDLTIENMALRVKGNLFTDLFGYEVQLLPAHE